MIRYIPLINKSKKEALSKEVLTIWKKRPEKFHCLKVQIIVVGVKPPAPAVAKEVFLNEIERSLDKEFFCNGVAV
ncbi:MAG: hypothetical protein GY909_10270 [Oligoflexia bacterium]|nr:hypothetical protein [Oligoflexia bacterium]